MKPVWLVGAVLLAAFVIARRRRLEPTLLVGGLLAAAGGFVYGLGVVDFPDLEKLLTDVGEALGTWTYLLVGVMAFLETGAFVGLLAPGETAIVVGGVVAGQGQINIIALIAVVWVCAVLGDVASFWLGRRLGRQFLVRHGPKVQITEERLHQVEQFYDRHGGKAVFLGRFVGLVRAVSPFIAASSGMPFRRFLPYDILGAGLWGTFFCLLGFLFWQSIGTVLEYAKTGAFALGTTIVVVVGLVWAYRKLKDPMERERLRVWLSEQERRPVIGPVVRLAMPVLRRGERPARFLFNRVTPGDLGLELTTLLAVAAVGSFALFGYLLALGPDVVTTPGDRRALRWADEVDWAWVVEGAKVVTWFGSFAVVAVVVVVATVALLLRDRALEAAGVASGFLLTWVVVRVIKELEERPRPTGGLVDAAGWSFPSGHAAYAIAYVAIAVAAARALRGLVSQAAVIAVGIALAAAIVLSRVFLRVHFLSDALAGAGAGAMCFAVCGIVALIVGYLRQNGRPIA